jgi:hypothetical protein
MQDVQKRYIGGCANETERSRPLTTGVHGLELESMW